MRVSLLAAIAALTLGGTSQLAGQSVALRPAPSVLFREAASPVVTAEAVEGRGSYWRQGAVIGGVAGAIYGGVAGSRACDGNSCVGPAIAFGAIAGFVGSFVGAMIGAQFTR